MIFDKLIDEIQRVLTKENFKIPTEIQEKSIPIILQKKDLIGIAQTGTGKTASFVLPILQLLSTNEKVAEPNSPLVLVLSPTRELAVQIDDTFNTFARLLKIKHKVVFGGVSSGPQIKALSKGVHILTATPGRLLDLISQGKVNLSKVECIVLDESHMMLDMGFLPSVKEIYGKISQNRQSLLFSATMSPEVLTFAHELLDNPTIVEVKATEASNLITQKVCFLYVENKNAVLLQLIKDTSKTIVFMRTKYKTDIIEKLLIKNKILARAIHSDKTQKERIQALDDFKSGKIRVLVATDIAARGIHIDNVSHVINYDIPNYPDVYIHRIGRTARAGSAGKSYSFCSLEEREFLRKIEEHTGQKMIVVKNSYYTPKVENATLESIAATIKKKKKNTHKKVAKRATKDSDVYVQPINCKKAKKPRGIHLKKNHVKFKRRK